MTCRVLLFGPYAEAVGAASVAVALSDSDPRTAASVLAQLARQQPKLRQLIDSARLAVNSRWVAPEHPISEDDELALIGLVSGG